MALPTPSKREAARDAYYAELRRQSDDLASRIEEALLESLETKEQP